MHSSCSWRPVDVNLRFKVRHSPCRGKFAKKEQPESRSDGVDDTEPRRFSPQNDRSSEGIDSTEQCQKPGCFDDWVGLNYQKARMDGDYHIISYTIHYVNTMNQQPTMMRDCPCHSVFDIAETQSCQDQDFGSKLFEMLCRTQRRICGICLILQLEVMRVQYEVVQ